MEAVGDNKLIRSVDSGVMIATTLLVICGLFAVYSATQSSDLTRIQLKFSRQLIWVALGTVVFIGTALAPMRFFYEHAGKIYGLTILLLILVLLLGHGSGARRWLSLGPAWLQPAEFAKIGTVLMLSVYLSKEHRNLSDFRDVAIAFLLALMPFFLILRQPDLGSAMVFLAIILPMLHWAGLSPAILFVLLAPIISLLCSFNFYSFFVAMSGISIALFLFRRGVRFFVINFVINIAVAVSTPIVWNMLKEYQQKRVLAFLGMVSDPHGIGYQVIQSKVAIGSGGILGKGFLKGTQTHLRFLPEQHTDFIFSVIGEEFGFFGVFVVLALFFYLIMKGVQIAAHVKNQFSSLLVFGVTVILLFQVFVNVGMTIGLMPVTGLPLPFFSYGGSSLLSSLIIVGLILNASRKRFEYL